MAELKNCPVCGTPAKMMVHDGCYSVEPIVPRWISVEERLPKVKGSYLVCGKHWIARSEPITTIHYWWGDSWAQSTVFEITHWMPLPEPPKEEHK